MKVLKVKKVIVFLLAFALFAGPVHAADENGREDVASAVVEYPAEGTVADEEVSSEDLDSEEDVILPDNPLYAFKRFGRGFRKAITFDDAKDLELDIRYANEELDEIRQMVEERGDESADAARKAFERMEKRLERIGEQKDELSDEEAVVRDRVLEDLVHSEVLRQKVLDKMEREAADARLLEEIQEVRDTASENVAEVLDEVPFDEAVFDRVLDRQRGSEFKDMRNLVEFKRIRDKVERPEIREAFDRTQERSFEEIRRRVERFDENEYETFEAHLDDFRGDDVRRFEVFDDFEEHLDDHEDEYSGEIRERLERAREIAKRQRDRAVREFERRFEEIDDRFEDRAEAIEENLKEAFRGGEDALDDDRFRRMREFRAHVHLEELREEIEETEDEEIDRFVKAFPDQKANTDKYRELRERKRRAFESGDFEALRVLEEAANRLEEEVKRNPEVRKYLEELDRARDDFHEDFVDEIRDHEDEFVDEFISDDPEHLEYLQELREQFRERGFEGEEFDPRFFDRVISEQSRHFSEEDHRKEQELRRDEDEFRRRAAEEREQLRREFEEQAREATSEEERRAIEEKMREKEAAFRREHNAKEDEIFRRQRELECGENTACREERKREHEERRAEFEELNRIERELHDLRRAEEERRRAQDEEYIDGEHYDDDFNPFEGVCSTFEECGRFCDQNRDDPRCIAAGEAHRTHMSDGVDDDREPHEDAALGEEFRRKYEAERRFEERYEEQPFGGEDPFERYDREHELKEALEYADEYHEYKEEHRFRERYEEQPFGGEDPFERYEEKREREEYDGEPFSDAFKPEEYEYREEHRYREHYEDYEDMHERYGDDLDKRFFEDEHRVDEDFHKPEPDYRVHERDMHRENEYRHEEHFDRQPDRPHDEHRFDDEKRHFEEKRFEDERRHEEEYRHEEDRRHDDERRYHEEDKRHVEVRHEPPHAGESHGFEHDKEPHRDELDYER